MGFDTPAGTRGARQPRAGRLQRWVIQMAAGRIRRPGKMMDLGFNALILTTVGARSGAERTNRVGWFPGPDGSWLIVASAAGAARWPPSSCTEPSATRHGGRSPPPRRASRSTSARPTANCRSSA
jgi:F420H(2)-dependent quinone reductase